MLGVELVQPDGEPDAALMDDLLENLKDRGFLVGKTGPDRNVLTLMPPLIINQSEIASLKIGLQAAFEEFSGS